MTRRFPRRWGVIAILPVMALVWLVRHRTERDGATGLNRLEARPRRPARLQVAAREEPDAARAERLKRTLIQVAAGRFLADRGRSAQSLAVAFMMTRNPAYLDEALSKDPNSIAALCLRIGARALQPRPDLVQRLRALEPDNPLWSVEEALVHVRSGDKPAAIAALRTALTLNSLHDPFTLLLSAEEEFRREFLGSSYQESLTDALSSRSATLTCDFYSIHRFLRSALNETHGSGSAEQARELTALALNLALLQARQSSVDGFRSGAANEDQFLRSLPHDLPMDQVLDRPLAEYREAVSADARLAEKLAALRQDFSRTASEAELRQYVERRNQAGEVAALQELLVKNGATSTSE